MREAVYNKMQREKITIIPKMTVRWLCAISLPKPSRRIDFVPLFNLQHLKQLFRGIFSDRTHTPCDRGGNDKRQSLNSHTSPHSWQWGRWTCPMCLGTGRKVTLLGVLNSIPLGFVPLPVASKVCVITIRGTSHLQKHFGSIWDYTHEVCQKIQAAFQNTLTCCSVWQSKELWSAAQRSK